MATDSAHQIKEEGVDWPRYRLLPSCRLLVTLMCLVGGTVAMLGRVQTSFAVLCMVRDVPDDPAASNATASATATPVQGEFEWSKQFQGLVLSAYFYGYVAALVVGGWVADRYPSHRVAICSALSQAVLLAMIPEFTRLQPISIVILRVMQGMAASVYYPSFNVILRNWSTAGEFSLLFSIAWSGGYLGSAAAFPASSVFCQSGWLGGWPAIFYVSAAALAAWALVACFVLTESPEHHRFVSEAERKCLTLQPHVQTSASAPAKRVSICTIMGSLQVWIIALSYFVTSWFFAALNITLPIFMKEGFNFDIRENGFVSALPSLCMGFMIIVGGKAHAYLHVNKGVSSTNSRKIISVIGLLVPAACMIAVISLPASQRYLSVVLISLAQGFSSIVISSGPVSAASEIAPQYIGFIWGIASSFGNTTGFLAPLIAAAMTPNLRARR
ncbi:uncharacterized transporter slc-17.2-like isoform X2 [Pollicipes pollicipes]|uniref:uncharacterized transporter slc-17.2-like isoform X2 n=1 Tax=Pollicipes pollicipes TaxID=41117 RepID=UPI0018851A3D|nr:uncharacterized transporter slc-17.2-like isoform X2 [Pollicipes pollicipes]XP_037075961.1 uncharacterized transporter slc-17.2-like isoform X2 [Pollicipes pollicipes]